MPMALQCSWPLFNSLFISLFFSKRNSFQKNRLLSKSVVGLLLGFAGVLILFLGDQHSSSHTSLSSACFALCAGASFGLYAAYSSTIRTDEHLDFMTLSSISGLVVLIPWALYTHSSPANLSAQQIGIAVSFGVFVDGLGTYLWTKVNNLVAQRGVNISTLTSITLALPFLSALLLYLFFGEQQVFQISFLIGLLFLLSGISVCNRK
jgi:drug/metabolite transporter (DMT)-like permease